MLQLPDQIPEPGPIERFKKRRKKYEVSFSPSRQVRAAFREWNRSYDIGSPIGDDRSAIDSQTLGAAELLNFAPLLSEQRSNNAEIERAKKDIRLFLPAIQAYYLLAYYRKECADKEVLDGMLADIRAFVTSYFLNSLPETAHGQMPFDEVGTDTADGVALTITAMHDWTSDTSRAITRPGLIGSSLKILNNTISFLVDQTAGQKTRLTEDSLINMLTGDLSANILTRAGAILEHQRTVDQLLTWGLPAILALLYVIGVSSDIIARNPALPIVGMAGYIAPTVVVSAVREFRKATKVHGIPERASAADSTATTTGEPAERRTQLRNFGKRSDRLAYPVRPFYHEDRIRRPLLVLGSSAAVVAAAINGTNVSSETIQGISPWVDAGLILAYLSIVIKACLQAAHQDNEELIPQAYQNAIDTFKRGFKQFPFIAWLVVDMFEKKRPMDISLEISGEHRLEQLELERRDFVLKILEGSSHRIPSKYLAIFRQVKDFGHSDPQVRNAINGTLDSAQPMSVSTTLLQATAIDITNMEAEQLLHMLPAAGSNITTMLEERGKHLGAIVRKFSATRPDIAHAIANRITVRAAATMPGPDKKGRDELLKDITQSARGARSHSPVQALLLNRYWEILDTAHPESYLHAEFRRIERGMESKDDPDYKNLVAEYVAEPLFSEALTTIGLFGSDIDAVRHLAKHTIELGSKLNEKPEYLHQLLMQFSGYEYAIKVAQTLIERHPLSEPFLVRAISQLEFIQGEMFKAAFGYFFANPSELIRDEKGPLNKQITWFAVWIMTEKPALFEYPGVTDYFNGLLNILSHSGEGGTGSKRSITFLFTLYFIDKARKELDVPNNFIPKLGIAGVARKIGVDTYKSVLGFDGRQAHRPHVNDEFDNAAATVTICSGMVAPEGLLEFVQAARVSVVALDQMLGNYMTHRLHPQTQEQLPTRYKVTKFTETTHGLMLTATERLKLHYAPVSPEDQMDSDVASSLFVDLKALEQEKRVLDGSIKEADRYMAWAEGGRHDMKS